MRRKSNDSKKYSLQDNVSPAEMRRMRVSMELADAIKNVLTKRNISNRQFADMMGADPSEVRHWLSGTYIFNIGTLYDIAERLGLL